MEHIDIIAALQHKIDFKTKPLQALGRLEKIALQIGVIQNTLEPVLTAPTIIVFAADHGIAKEGVSPYPQEVTHQMVLNFLNGGAGINVFARQNKMALKVVDAGVNFDFGNQDGLIIAKIAYGTKSYLDGQAMTPEQYAEALKKGANIVNDIAANGCNVVGFGEMGIGNTSSAAILMSLFCKIPIAACVGRGTGLDNAGVQKKKEVLEAALKFHSTMEHRSENILQTFGGFEIVMMCGAMMRAAELKMLVLVDGFITTSALVAAFTMHPPVLENCIFCHQSDEQGHKLMLDYLKVEPLMQLNMRLGEGTGVAVAYPIIEAAVNFLNEMASFESAGVTNKA